MAVVDRNILRLATFELAHTETAAAIVINEAVELARRFGSDESPPFVNGVLDAVARKERTEEFK
jgi:N utilization substance protein B